MYSIIRSVRACYHLKYGSGLKAAFDALSEAGCSNADVYRKLVQFGVPYDKAKAICHMSRHLKEKMSENGKLAELYRFKL